MIGKKDNLVIAVDFDGTCVEHMYPVVGPDCPNSVNVLKKLTNRGHKLILFTMRGGQTLLDAENWFSEKGIPLWSSQKNPEQHIWTDSPKCYADLYIDDSGLGAFLTGNIQNGQLIGNPYIDWNLVEEFLTKLGIL